MAGKEGVLMAFNNIGSNMEGNSESTDRNANNHKTQKIHLL